MYCDITGICSAIFNYENSVIFDFLSLQFKHSVYSSSHFAATVCMRFMYLKILEVMIIQYV